MTNEQKEYLFNECLEYARLQKEESGSERCEARGAYSALRDAFSVLGISYEYREYRDKRSGLNEKTNH